MSNIGKNSHRLNDNPLELEFAKAWEKANDGPYGTLKMIMGDGNRPGTVHTQDEIVAATAIQWLGSPVGQSFLIDVLETDAGKEFLKHLGKR